MKKKLFKNLLTLFLVVTFFSGIFPSLYVEAAPTEQPGIVAKTAITLDVETGEIIYAKGIDEQMYPASVTKMMTALLFAENKSKDERIPYTESAKAQPAYSLSTDIMRNKIKVGDTMRADDVMEALLLFSANDSAYMIADSVGGNTANFIKMMNDKASELGLKNTNFVTANGLHDDNHYTTAYDLSVIGRAAAKNDWVKEVLSTKDARIETSAGIIAYVQNRNKLLGQNGAIGGKTGYTSKAGRCLLAIYERDGRSLVGVVMKSVYDAEDSQVFKDMETIINWSYDVATPSKIYEKDATVKTETLSYKPFRYFGPEKSIEVPVLIKDEASYYENTVNKEELKTDISINPIDVWNLSKDSKLGELTVTQREASKSYELYTTLSTKDITAANTTLYLAAGIGVFIGLLIIFMIMLIVRKNLNRGKVKTRYKR